MDRSQKEKQIASLHSIFKEAKVIIIAHYSGLTVAEMSDLRNKMRASQASLKVTKNRLSRIALDGTNYKSLNSLFAGPTIIAYAKDPVAPAKIAVDFAKVNEKLVIIGGAYGERLLNADDVRALASMPSLDESRAKLVGLLVAPATRIAVVLKAPAGQVARVIGAHANQDKAA